MTAFGAMTKISDTDDRLIAPSGERSLILTGPGPTSYDTGGSLPDFPTNASVNGAIIDAKAVEDDGSNAYRLRWDRANSKFKAYVASTEAQVAGAVDLSGVTFRFDITAEVEPAS